MGRMNLSKSPMKRNFEILNLLIVPFMFRGKDRKNKSITISF